MTTAISVGEKFPLFEKSLEQLKGQDGCVFEALEEGNGFVLSILFQTPHPQEVNIIEQKTMTVRLIEEDDFVLPLLRFGNSNLIFELHLDPTLYDDQRVFQMTSVNNLVLVVLIDSMTSKVVALRHANLPLNMINTCSRVWRKAMEDPDYSARYTAWVENLQQLPLYRLWQKGTYAGKMGEVFSVDDVQKDS